jgi:5-methylcytosine-specific restriction endonuclease McrA
VSEGLPLLATRINQARQLTQNLRGVTLDTTVADEIAGRLREAARLLQGKEVSPNKWKPPPKLPQTGTLRYRLWQRDPRCLWCGRVTLITGTHEPDAATLDHLHRKKQRTGRVLPVAVLACRECNNHRGEPPAVKAACPFEKGVRR